MTRDSGTLYWLPRILARTDLDATSTLILVGLADHVGGDDEAHCKITRLADYGRCSYPTARRRLDALTALGFISRTRLKRDDGGDSVYRYRLDRAAFATPPAQSDQAPPAHLGARAPLLTGRAGPPAHPGERAEVPPKEPPPKEPNPSAADAAGDGSLFGGAAGRIVDPFKVSAEEMTRRLWDERATKPTTKYVAVRALVERFLRAQHDPGRLFAALMTDGPFTDAAIEFRLARAAEREPTRRGMRPADHTSTITADDIRKAASDA